MTVALAFVSGLALALVAANVAVFVYIGGRIDRLAERLGAVEQRLAVVEEKLAEHVREHLRP